MKAVGIIPARLNSTRLPRKALLAETGKSLIQHTWETAMRVRSFDRVIVATDSEEIAEVVRSFGGCCEMTGVHQSGTDRVAEVVRRCCLEAEIVVNLQGDEPELDPIHIDAAINALNHGSRYASKLDRGWDGLCQCFESRPLHLIPPKRSLYRMSPQRVALSGDRFDRRLSPAETRAGHGTFFGNC